MDISLRTDSGEPIKLKWLNRITKSLAVMDGMTFPQDLSKNSLSDLIFDFQTTNNVGQCKWINKHWYGSIINDQNQQYTALSSSQTRDFIPPNNAPDENREFEAIKKLKPTFKKKPNSKAIIALLLFLIAASILFQINYQNFQSSDRHDIPEYTLVANFDSTLLLFVGQYFSGTKINDSYLEIHSDKSVTMNVITQAVPSIAAFSDEHWTITEIGINDYGFVIILNEELALIVDNHKQTIDFYGDTFERI